MGVGYRPGIPTTPMGIGLYACKDICTWHSQPPLVEQTFDYNDQVTTLPTGVMWLPLPVLMAYVVLRRNTAPPNEGHTMATKTLTAQTLASVQAAFIAQPATLALSRDKRSGSEWADLTRKMHAADARCTVCALPTVLASGARRPEAARLLVLVPCALSDDNGGRDRMGYVPGNLALACHDCVRRINDYGVATGEAIVMGPDCLSLPGNVWLAWPALAKRAAVVNDHAEAARKARAALGLPF